MTAISVCMPTYRRPGQLTEALERITSLEASPGGYEVVVVDDGTPPDAGVVGILEKAAAGSPVPVRWHSFPENRGAAAARNEAWRRAEGDWIAFTDDDCVPRPDWLVHLLAAGREADVVQGRTVPDPARVQLMSHPLARSIRVEQFDGRYQTCNIAYRRSLLEQLGGFDEGYRLACDDTDLGLRAEESGAVAVFAPDAVVEHEVVVHGWRSEIRSRRRWADVVRIARIRPDGRRLGWNNYIFRQAHVPILVIAGASPLLAWRLTRWLWLGGVAAAIGSDVVKAGAPDAAVAKLVERAADAYEVSVVVKRAVRERTLAL